jgi:sugar lactone lactonase YvrE
MSATAGNTMATVSWNVPKNGGSSITSYMIYVYDSAGVAISPTSVNVTDATILASSEGASVSWPVRDLTNGTTYKFNIRATNTYGNSAITQIYTNTIMPRPPVGNVTTLVSDANIMASNGYGGLDPTNTYLYTINSARNGINIINLSNGSYTAYSLYNSTGSATMSSFNQIAGSCMDSTGAFFFADYLGKTIYKVVLSNGKYCCTAIIAAPNISYPGGLCSDSVNNIYVCDSGNRRILMLSPASSYSATVIAGNGTNGPTALQDNNSGGSVNFGNNLNGITIDTSGNLYVTDNNTYRVRRLRNDGGGTYYVSTIAGGSGTAAILSGYVDGNGVDSRLSGLGGIALDPSGNLFVVDINNRRICMLVPNSDYSNYTTYSVCGAYTSKTTSGTITTYTGAIGGYSDGSGQNASFNLIRGIYVIPSGNIYVLDVGGQVDNVDPVYSPTIRRITIS